MHNGLEWIKHPRPPLAAEQKEVRGGGGGGQEYGDPTFTQKTEGGNQRDVCCQAEETLQTLKWLRMPQGIVKSKTVYFS